MVDFIQRHKRILDIAACLSLATVFVVTLLRFFPPLFYGAGVVGDLFFDFGMAFLTAWTFHFMPRSPVCRQRDKEAGQPPQSSST